MDRVALPEVIRTARLLLRPFRLEDHGDVFEYARDPEWSRFLRTLPRPYGPDDAKRFVARQLLLDPVQHPAWALVLDDTVVGGINLRFEFEHGRAELGYALARARWNRGLTSEAARAVIDAAFATHEDLNRVFARADAANVGSRRVMEKVGMTREGVLRMNRIERGEPVDEAWFAILRREWAG